MTTKEVLTDELPPPPPAPPPGQNRVVIGLVGLVVLVLGVMALLSLRTSSQQSQETLAGKPRGVTVVTARATTYRDDRRYVGVVEPWIEAKLGPEFISSWVATVLVRPGDRVKRGDVLATLDCRNASSNTESAAQQARSLEERQGAMASEAARLENLLGGGFVSANEIEQKKSQAAANEAQLGALRAQLRNRSLEVSDCVLRAPFDGEVAVRAADPGSFVHAGQSVFTIIDRHLYRVVLDVPEIDFPLVELNSPVDLHLLATGQRVSAVISRRAPSASTSTRTLHVEVDLSAKDVSVPVGTTAEVRLEVGASQPASELPLLAARVRGAKATLFIVTGGVSKKIELPVLGERDGSLFLSGLPPNAEVVTEGRATLADGDRVAAKVDPSWPPPGMTGVPRASTTADATNRGGRP